MISEERIAEILGPPRQSRSQAADQLIDEANEAGGRDNITVVLFRLEEVGADAPIDAPTMVGDARTRRRCPAETSTPPPRRSCHHRPPAHRRRARRRPRRHRQSRAAGPHAGGPPPDGSRGRRQARKRRYIKPLAALLATLIVLALIGAGGYLASRQLYFLGTNQQGIVTIYRGFPYDLPAGIHLYETLLRLRRAGSGAPGRPPRLAAQPPPALAVGRREAGDDPWSSGQLAQMSARNRELLGLIPASLLVTAGFAGVFIQRSNTALEPDADLRRDLPRAVRRRPRLRPGHAAATPTRTCSRWSRCWRASGS